MLIPRKVPDDLCPIATDLIVMNTGDWRSERPIVLRSKWCEMRDVLGILPGSMHS